MGLPLRCADGRWPLPGIVNAPPSGLLSIQSGLIGEIAAAWAVFGLRRSGAGTHPATRAVHGSELGRGVRPLGSA